MIVLDASALLAFLFGETGGERVGPLLDNSGMSTVNLSEVLGRFARDGHDPDIVSARLSATSLEIVPFARGHALFAALLLPLTRPIGLSFADRACLALAQARGISAVTADRDWKKLNVKTEIVLIR